jgi:hypothetical protein
MGAFNLWAWQLIWIIGMWAGAKWAGNDLLIEEWAQRTWIPAACITAIFLVIRYAEILGAVNLPPGTPGFNWNLVFDKWHLGLFRLIDFAAITTVLVRFQSAVKPLAFRPLVLLGQSSLQVFVTHFVFCFLGLGLMGSDPRLYGWRQFALLAVTFAALLAVAKLCAKPGDGATTNLPTPAPLIPAVQTVPTLPSVSTLPAMSGSSCAINAATSQTPEAS